MNLADLSRDPRLPPLTQNYEAYTEDDHATWKILFERQHQFISNHACSDFLIGVNNLGLSADRIVCFEDVSRRLISLTGWEVKVVPGQIDEDLLLGLLSHRKFPSSAGIRKIGDLDFAQEPDLFHDAYAHLPLLTHKRFADFVERLAALALTYLDNPLALGMLARVYRYTVEFGLIWEEGRLKVYGAGILSSIGETKFALSSEPKHVPFDLTTVLLTPYWKNRFQDRYFVIEDFDQLGNAIPAIKAELTHILAKSVSDDL